MPPDRVARMPDRWSHSGIVVHTVVRRSLLNMVVRMSVHKNRVAAVVVSYKLKWIAHYY